MKHDLTPRTKAGTPIKIAGRPRKDSTVGGMHLLLYPSFKRMLSKSKDAATEWSKVEDQQAFFIRLAVAALLPLDSDLLPSHLAYCYRIAPDFTCRALPVLRRKAKGLSMEDHRGACVNPGLERDAIGNRLPRVVSNREAKARHTARKAQEQFIRDTRRSGI